MNSKLLSDDTLAEAMMLTPKDVAILLQCSPRHVSRLEKEGLIPRAERLRSLVRWPRKTIEDWIAAGCPAISA